MDLAPGQVLGNYRIVRLLGKGGMGAVYEAEHLKLGVRYALKTYTLADDHADLFRKRFQAEGKILARLRHPNLVRVFDLDYAEAAGILYYVMDLVLYKDGEAHTLADIEDGGADEDHVFRWFSEMCEALAYVHAQGVVHRDVKLDNILLAPERHVVLSDFGISRVVDEQLRSAVDVTRTLVCESGEKCKFIMGTDGYVAPEVLTGERPTPASDVYALGVVFFRLLTGVWYDPSLSPKAANLATGKMDAVKLLSHFDRRWEDVLPRMLADDPAERPLNLRELPGMLTGRTQREERSVFRSRVRWALVAGLAVVVLAGAYVGLRAFRIGKAEAVSDPVLEAAFDPPESLK